MSSPETKKVELIAICYPQPDKLERFRTLVASFIAVVETKERDTRSFYMVEELDATEPRVIIVESYANHEAMEAHQNSAHFQDLFAKFEEEEVMVKPPQQIVGKAIAGFVR